MKKVILLFGILLSGVVHSATKDQPWNWYFASFNSPSVGSEIFVRSGIAQVLISGEDVQIKFSESRIPELKATFTGKINREGDVKGVLDKFFQEGEEVWGGRYSILLVSKNCKIEEILIRSGVPDGSVLAVTRTGGECQ